MRFAPRRANLDSSVCRSSSSRKAATPHVESAFKEIARLTGGAYARFDESAVGELAALLRAVAAYAAGGRKALTDQGGRKAQLLLEQLR